MPRIMKKHEEHYSGTIVYSGDATENVDFDSFDIVRDTTSKCMIVKCHEAWRNKAEAIRYFEKLVQIIKEEF